MTIRCLQVANAGVGEIGDYLTPKVKNGKPEKPNVTTVNVNFLGLIYSENHPFDYTCVIYLVCICSSCTPGHLLSGAWAKVR